MKPDSSPHFAPLRVLHIINDLSVGGAETMLCKLVSSTDRTRIAPIVLTLSDRGPLRERVSEAGVPIHSLHLQSKLDMPLLAGRLRRVLRVTQPDLIQGWLFLGNFAAHAAGNWLAPTVPPLMRRLPVVWNIRYSLYSLPTEKPATAIAFKLAGILSRSGAAIIYNSRVSARQHEEIGYRSDKTRVIPNGFDTQMFAPSTAARLEIRRELQLNPNTILIGLFGRYYAMKDHPNFLRAAALLGQSHPHVHFLLAGRGIHWQNEPLCALIHELNLKPNIHLLNERYDMPRLSAALDIASCSSYDEGFPNVIGEAMSCGVPCAVTEVSDLAWIVGDTGRVVPPRDAPALAQAWQQLIEIGASNRETLGQAARARIIEHFSLDSVTTQYQNLYQNLVSKSSSDSGNAT